MSDKDIESEIQAKGLTAPRVTPQHIESIILSESYFTAADGAAGRHQYLLDTKSENEKVSELDINPSLSLLTFCVLVLRNGFTVTGESACASPENFDPEIGRKIARENAVNKIWMLEGYLLKQRLHDDRSDVWENEDDCRRALDAL
ncbi:MAG: Gp49 family protein [Hafnia sp.]